MAEEEGNKEEERFPREVGAKERRRLKALREKDRGVWFGFGMFGLVGWAVAIPTLLGIAVGIWLDRKWPGPPSWTLTGLFIGIVLGCLNGWYWIKKESKGE